jgi:ribosomal protein S18 acetylase RimI-like enzyme
MDIRVMGPGDAAHVADASHLFDGPAQAAATERFLNEPGHHLVIAYEGDEPAGFISGVEMTHPDKGTEMFVYELSVDEPFRRMGIALALIERLKSIAVEQGCFGMWVLTDEGNTAALATYQSAGGNSESGQVVLEWTF